jgi:hypothetical protein
MEIQQICNAEWVIAQLKNSTLKIEQGYDKRSINLIVGFEDNTEGLVCKYSQHSEYMDRYKGVKIGNDGFHRALPCPNHDETGSSYTQRVLFENQLTPCGVRAAEEFITDAIEIFKKELFKKTEKQNYEFKVL